MSQNTLFYDHDPLFLLLGAGTTTGDEWMQ
jgi:hypothetical protein